jgi:parallel beta-helix repeat protein
MEELMGRSNNMAISILSYLFLFISCQPASSPVDREDCRKTKECPKLVDGFKATHFQNVTLSVSVDKESPPTDIHIAKKMDVPWGSVEAFDFQPDNLTFSTSARLSVNINDLLLPPGVKKESLRIAALDGRSWKILPEGEFPDSSENVTALLDHCSIYGIVPAPGETSGVGTELSLNGVTLTTSEEVHAVLRVTPGIVVAYFGQKPGRVVSIVISGLPESGEHFMYVAGSTNPIPVVGGSASVTLALDEPKILWVQPFRATVHIGGPDDQCSLVGYGDGNRCTLTSDLTGEISIDGDDQTLDCNGHLLTQYASYPGSGIGILVSGRTGILIENCRIGAGSAGYGDGVLVDFSSDVTLQGCEIESSDVAVELVSSSGCTVIENLISGETREGIILRDDSFGNTVSGDSVSTTLAEGTTSLALRGAIYISDIGEDIIVLVRENVIEENTFEGAENGILFSLTADNDILRNDVSSTADAIKILNSEWTDRFYHNNINGEARGAYSESAPAELSYAGGGNYWGRNCPGPLFVPGEDSNRSDVVDSQAFSEPDAWDLGLPPGCGPAGDMDWDGIPDGVDNCPTAWNPGQENVDGENEGDACDVTPPESPIITYPVHGGIFDFEIGMVQGSAELRSLVKIYEAGQVIVQGFSDDSGLFSFDLDEPSRTDSMSSRHFRRTPRETCLFHPPSWRSRSASIRPSRQ